MFITTIALLLLPICSSALGLSRVSRRATCAVVGKNNAGIDDVPAIVTAFSSCGNGGIIKFSAGITYNILSSLTISACTNCEVQIEGTIKSSDNLDYWEGKTGVFVISGVNGMNVHSATGTGVVDGNGQPYYDEFAANSSYRRPTLWYIQNSQNVNIHNLAFKNAPNVFHSATSGTSQITYDSLTLTASSKSSNAPKNTDGFDISGTHVTVSNTKVSNQDDCVAFKSGANFITVTNITCSGSHGISVGSLGSSAGKTDSVTNVLVNGATMETSTKSVGLKLYDGGSSHGKAIVSNVTFSNINTVSSDYAFQIQSCYDAASTTECTSTPSTASVTGVTFTGFTGTTSGKFGQVVGNLNCPAAGICNIVGSSISVKPPSGSAEVQCSNIDNSNSGFTCSGAGSG